LSDISNLLLMYSHIIDRAIPDPFALDFELTVAPLRKYLENIYAFVTPSLKVHPVGSRGNKELRMTPNPEMIEHANALGIRYFLR